MTIENAILLQKKASKDEKLRLELESLNADDFIKLATASGLPCSKEEYLQSSQESVELEDDKLADVVGGTKFHPHFAESKNHGNW